PAFLRPLSRPASRRDARPATLASPTSYLSTPVKEGPPQQPGRAAMLVRLPVVRIDQWRPRDFRGRWYWTLSQPVAGMAADAGRHRFAQRLQGRPELPGDARVLRLDGEAAGGLVHRRAR